MPALFKQRLITLPTLWGLLIIGLVLSTVMTIGFSQLAFFLAPHKPIQGQYLVVEGWIDEPALVQAMTTFDRGQYQLLITTGGPNIAEISPEYHSYADKAAAFLLTQGFQADKLISVPAPASDLNRTYISAVMLKQWLHEHDLMPKSFDLFSSDVHARRTYQLYRMAFDDQTGIGIIPAKTNRYKINTWWQNSEGIKAVLIEFIGVTYTFCCFDPSTFKPDQEARHLY